MKFSLKNNGLLYPKRKYAFHWSTPRHCTAENLQFLIPKSVAGSQQNVRQVRSRRRDSFMWTIPVEETV